jgi:hypothetical protein
VNFSLTFSSSLVGSRNVYLYASGLTGLNSGFVNSGTWTPNPGPTITSLSPNTKVAGGGAFTLTINGTNFVSGATAKWNTSSLAVTFVSSTELTATIGEGLSGPVGTDTVTVTTPFGTSNGATFTLTPRPPFMGSLSPSSINAGSAAFTLTVNGANFISAAVVDWGTTALATTFVNSGELTAAVPASLIATTGTANVTVTDSAGTSTAATFTINPSQPPTLVSVSPNSGTGLTVTLTATYSDPQGAQDINQAWLLVNSSSSGAGACFVYYHPQSNQLYLRNDAGSAWLTPALTPGGAGTLANSQCTLSAASSSASLTGNNLILNVSLTFTGAFTGAKNVYMYASGLVGLNSGLVKEGTWTP